MKSNISYWEGQHSKQLHLINDQYREIVYLKSELSRLREQNSQLEYRLCIYEYKESLTTESRIPFKEMSPVLSRVPFQEIKESKKRKASPIPDPISFGKKSCFSCRGTVPFGYWIKDHDHPGELNCQKCYKKQFPKHSDFIENPITSCTQCPFYNPNCDACLSSRENIQLYCYDCHQESHHFFKSPIGDSHRLCLRCYMQKSRSKVDTLTDGTIVLRTCISCRNCKSSCWYKDIKTPGAYVCKQCYNHRYQSQLEVLPDGTVLHRTCAQCQVSQSPTWARDGNGSFLCKKCYKTSELGYTLINPEIKFPNRCCNVCSIQSSTRWYKDVRISGAYMCVSCYNKS